MEAMAEIEYVCLRCMTEAFSVRMIMKRAGKAVYVTRESAL